ncbi:MAG TPA: phospholipase D family protein [Anaeromyxobacteraceae bacterium]|nr:phospholipase D family protein [Anaeromyxobacteraceae bacterium]
MQVATVTTADFGLLHAVRDTLRDADDAYLCVAFAHERGVRLLEKELEALRVRKARVRMLVTTAFDRGGSTGEALALARQLGVDVRVHNHAGGTFHPKLYLGASGREAGAVIGSANLTAGLACNVEVGVALRGKRVDAPIATAWHWGEQLWQDTRSEAWLPQAAEQGSETIAPDLLAALSAAQRLDPVFMTLGPRPKPNRVVEVTPTEVFIETEETRRKRSGPQPVPAWMLNIAWDYLRTRGELRNVVLLDELRVHRSSAVCAMLARVPGVEVVKGQGIVLRWTVGVGEARRERGRS